MEWALGIIAYFGIGFGIGWLVAKATKNPAMAAYATFVWPIFILLILPLEFLEKLFESKIHYD